MSVVRQGFSLLGAVALATWLAALSLMGAVQLALGNLSLGTGLIVLVLLLTAVLWLAIRRSQAPARSAREIWLTRAVLYLSALPILALMTKALVNDPGRMGEATSSSGGSLFGFVAIALVLSSLLSAVWALSEFRFRTAVAIFQIVVVWVGGLLYQQGIREEISAWDVAEDLVLLVTTLLQLIPDLSSATGSGQDGATRPRTCEV